MSKEYSHKEMSDQIERLELRKARLPQILDERRTLYENIGTGTVRIDPTDINSAVRVGRTKEKVSKSVERLEMTAQQIDLEIDAFRYIQFSRSYDKARHLLNEGHLSEDEMAPFVEKKTEYEERFGNEPKFRDQVNKIFEREKRQSISEEPVAHSFIMPDGTKLFGVRAHILGILNSATVDNPVTTLEIGKQVYEGQEHDDSKLMLLVGGNLGSIRSLLKDTLYSVKKVKREDHMTPGYYLEKPSEVDEIAV